MIQIRRVFWGSAILLTALWLFANPDVLEASGFFAVRGDLIQYSGIMAIAAMSFAMILAQRSRWSERWLDGLDKAYRLHKWLGIAGLVLAISHWLMVSGPRWAVSLGWLARPDRGPRPAIDNPVQSFLTGFRDPAEGLGNIAFYAAVALILVSLVKLIPYGVFRRLHKLFPVVYLVLVIHSVVLTNFAYWLTPLGLVLAILMAGGGYAAFISLFGLIGVRRRVKGEITDLQSYPGVRALRSTVSVDSRWPGHAAGQFAFVASNRREGFHPYTIASAWNAASREIVFVTKALGDHTKRLQQTLKQGQEVTLEGPYGRFIFADDCPFQIWVGGGIGITPFIARMHFLAQQGGIPGQEVHLFHTTAEVDRAALDRLASDAQGAGVRLHVLIDAQDGLLTGARIRETVPGWRNASFWFCGPTGFGDALRKDFVSQGFPANKRFHQELFAMR
jgi:predicted ferric reductase